MNEELLNKIETLAGPLRGKTFRTAAEFILTHDCRNIVETGCYRGIEGDGNSTLILAMLAKETDGLFTSVDTNASNCAMAEAHLEANGLSEYASVINSDSVSFLSGVRSFYSFVYLDSFDHDPANPGPCQRHELAEIGAIYGKTLKTCAILLDDCIPETGGKTLLGSQFLEDRGWKKIASGYQLLYALY